MPVLSGITEEDPQISMEIDTLVRFLSQFIRGQRPIHVKGKSRHYGEQRKS